MISGYRTGSLPGEQKQPSPSPQHGSVLVVGAGGYLRDIVARALGDSVVDAAGDVALRDQQAREVTAAVVLTDLHVPGLRTRFAAGSRFRRRRSHYRRLVRSLHDAQVSRLVVVSSAFLYGAGNELSPTAPIVPAPETLDAWAAEEAARNFSALGGQVVVLRPGWTYYNSDGLTREVVAAANRGWQLIEGSSAALVPAISAGAVAAAVPLALHAPPGVHNLVGDRGITQSDVNAVLRAASGRRLHSLSYPGWRGDSTLFGASRQLSGPGFPEESPLTTPSIGLLPHLFDIVRTARDSKETP